MLSNLVASEDITHTVSNRLTVLPADSLSKILLVPLEELLELEHVSDSVRDRDHLPGVEGVLVVLDSFIEFSISGLRDSSENSLGKRADLVNPFVGG